jgi:hypothetical protein
MNLRFVVALAGAALIAACASAVEEPFPLADVVAQARQAASFAKATPSGLSREDYLKTSAGIVAFFRHFQNPDGRILDPYSGKEVQYSTPCYAWAAAALVSSGHQTNLLDSASFALDAALDELSTGRVADNHGDFFTFPAMLAYEALRDHVSNERRAPWERELREIEPQRVYQDAPGKREPYNWAIVALCGEFLRHQDGFCDQSFVEKALALQMTDFTADGQYVDPGAPMAYDGFPRCFLSAMIERGYDGAESAALSNLLDRAAWTSLLLQSPCGEWPTGGRSAGHQWNEAMQCMTYEIWARRKQREGDTAGAQMFKRAAHLSLESIRRWVRPSGELWVVKNHFDPALRHGYERYSFHSQYNLLSASMMCAAWLFEDEHIPEGVCPAQTGGFAFELPEFHKIIANAGGLYVELDTAAAPEYNSTGLIRVNKTDVNPLVGPTDGGAINEGPAAVGIAWPDGDHWQSLASLGRKQINRAEFSNGQNTADHVSFKVRYVLNHQAIPAVSESYDLTPDRVQVAVEAQGDVSRLLMQFPAITFDGGTTTQITISGSNATVRLSHSQQSFSVISPSSTALSTSGTMTSFRNGYFEIVEGRVSGNRVVYCLTPSTQE